jgi:hypothetical protein
MSHRWSDVVEEANDGFTQVKSRKAKREERKQQEMMKKKEEEVEEELVESDSESDSNKTNGQMVNEFYEEAVKLNRVPVLEFLEYQNLEYQGTQNLFELACQYKSTEAIMWCDGYRSQQIPVPDQPDLSITCWIKNDDKRFTKSQ